MDLSCLWQSDRWWTSGCREDGTEGFHLSLFAAWANREVKTCGIEQELLPGVGFSFGGRLDFQALPGKSQRSGFVAAGEEAIVAQPGEARRKDASASSAQVCRQ